MLPKADPTHVNIFLMLSVLWRGGKYGYFWRKADKKTKWCEMGTPYRIPTTGDDIYWGVHPTTCIPAVNAQDEPVRQEHARGQNRYIAAVNCLFAEFDAKDFGGSFDATRAFMRNRLFTPPSAVIASGGGFHGYWFLSQPVMLTDDNRADMDALQKRFVTITGGDDGAKDLARVLRVPGTWNTKYDTPRMVEIVEFSRTEYDLLDLVGMMNAAAPLPELTNPIVDGVTSGHAGNGLEAFVAGSVKGERNKKLFWAANRAFDHGATLADVESNLLPLATQNGLTEREVKATIRSASAQQRRTEL